MNTMNQSKTSNSATDSNCKTSESHRSNQNLHRSLISLSKLKEYMPQNQFGHKVANETSVLPLPGPSALSQINHYRSNLEFLSPSSYPHFTAEQERIWRSKALCQNKFNWTTRLVPGSHKTIDGAQNFTGNHFCASHVASETSNLGNINFSHQSTITSRNETLEHKSIKTTKELGQNSDNVDYSSVQDNLKLKAGDSLLKDQKKTDSKVTSPSPSRLGKANFDLHQEPKRSAKGTSNRNNMTPSSLVLLQNHNYIEQQHQRTALGSYHDTNRCTRNLGVSLADRNISQECVEGRMIAGDEEIADNQHATCVEGTLSPNEASLMSNNINQFKASDGLCNTSADSGRGCATNAIMTSGSSVADSIDYTANQGIREHIHNHLPTSEVHHGGSVNNLHQDYHNGVTNQDMRSATGSQFVNYSHEQRITDNSSYLTSSTGNSMLEHHNQLKLENSSINMRNFFEENVSGPQVHETNLHGHAASDVFGISRAPSQQNHQVRTSVGQHYGMHYNLMQTPSAKSTSSLSSNSTPSPKTNNNVNQSTGQYLSPHISSSLSSTPSSHPVQIDHLNHHYVNNQMPATNIHHHQPNQIGNQYSYNQRAVGGSSQHNLATMTATQEQSYAHHQQQLPHQQHQQQINAQQSIYQQLAATNAAGVNHIYGNGGNNSNYQNHLQVNSNNHQQAHLIGSSHPNHLNSAAAACAAAVVSQTLKTVANQHGQSHHYSNTINGGFVSNSGLMNMAQHSNQFQGVTPLVQHQVHNGTSNQQLSSGSHHHTGNNTTSIVARKYQCKMCPQVFMSKAEMKYHNQNHMREAKPYKCLQCPKAFANSSYLSQHMRIHQGVKPYTCDICSRKFTQLSHLQQHKRTHTGDKPYKCTYANCTKQFSQLSNLQSHSRWHQLDKPYKCNSCYKCFHDEQSLLEHIPRHLESKHLKKNLCIFCGSSYQQERGLVKHFQQYHTDKTPTLVAAAIAAGTTGNTSMIASLVSSTTSSTFATPRTSGGSSSSSSCSSSISSNNNGISGALCNSTNINTHMNLAQGSLNH